MSPLRDMHQAADEDLDVTNALFLTKPNQPDQGLVTISVQELFHAQTTDGFTQAMGLHLSRGKEVPFFFKERWTAVSIRKRGREVSHLPHSLGPSAPYSSLLQDVWTSRWLQTVPRFPAALLLAFHGLAVLCELPKLHLMRLKPDQDPKELQGHEAICWVTPLYFVTIDILGQLIATKRGKLCL